MVPLLPMGIVNFFDWLMTPIYWIISGMMVLFHKVYSPIFGFESGWSWALTIVTITVIVRLLLLPLFVKQMRSSRAMQALQPKIKELQKKFGNDREKLGAATMALYRSEGVNPMASCLPLLFQMPVFIGLFQVLNGAARGTARGYFMEKHPELVTALRDSTIFGGKLSGTFLPIERFGATQILCLSLIIFMCVTLVVQQLMMLRRNTPPAALDGPLGKQQKMLIWLFPIIYAFTGVAIPIGVLVYWFATNVWTFAQQYFLIRAIPTPGTPAYADWEERMRAKGKDPKAIENARVEKRRAKSGYVPPVRVVTESEKETISDSHEKIKYVKRVQPKSQSRSQRNRGGFKPKKK